MIIALIACGVGAHQAAAQLVLPGAVTPAPAGNVQTPRTPAPKAKAAVGAGQAHVAHGTVVAVPTGAALVGRTMTMNGAGSQITFVTAEKTLAVARLSLMGEKTDTAHEACRVDLSSNPLPVSPLGRPNGLERFRVGFPACPFVFDVLDGALLVDAEQEACVFTDAHCTVRTAGLWGAAPAEIGPDRVKSLERTRASAEAAVRSNYKALTASTKDRPTIMGIAHDQAQFSSSREEVCREYADEGRHGYCAAKLTEARAALLSDRLGTALAEKAARKAKRRAGG